MAPAAADALRTLDPQAQSAPPVRLPRLSVARAPGIWNGTNAYVSETRGEDVDF